MKSSRTNRAATPPPALLERNLGKSGATAFPRLAGQRHKQLLMLFAETFGVITEAPSCDLAITYIRETEFRLVVCEQDLPDGSWKEILAATAAVADPPSLIVTSRLADDRLWAEVLNLGGYDVLAQPFDREEVRRVAMLARDHRTQSRASLSAFARGAEIAA
jgi:DNA-binding response OmpR family regulator